MGVTTSENRPIPSVVFREPQDDQREMSIREYRRAVAECIVEAARKGMCEPSFLSGHKPPRTSHPLATVGGALVLIERLEESDQNRREWLCVEFMSPEINYCIQTLRDMRKVARLASLGAERLAVLQGAIAMYGTVPTPPAIESD